MRAEQWFMIAVGGLGLYAVYRIVTNKPSESDSRTSPPASALPETPGAPPILLQNILGKNTPGSALVRAGTPYRGRLELPPSVSRAQSLSMLQGLGFADVSVYMNIAEAKEDDAIPLPDALTNPAASSRWFSATWRGVTGTKAFPRELVLLWPTVSLPSRSPGTGNIAYPGLGGVSSSHPGLTTYPGMTRCALRAPLRMTDDQGRYTADQATAPPGTIVYLAPQSSHVSNVAFEGMTTFLPMFARTHDIACATR